MVISAFIGPIATGFAYGVQGRCATVFTLIYRKPIKCNLDVFYIKHDPPNLKKST